MSDKKLLPITILDEFLPNSVGHDVIRYICLPELLGEESDTLLYFAGRRLARKFDIKTRDDIYYMFNKMGWGKLELIKDKKNSIRFHLMSDEIVKRMKSSLSIDFRLESGFLTEAIQIITERPCECFEKTNNKLYRTELNVIFTDL